MYLSRLELDLKSPSVRQSLRNCQDMHRNIMKAFDVSRSAAQVLYRVVRTDQRIMVYVQSMAEPQWERIADHGYCCTGMRDISALMEKFTADTILHFSILACPAKKVRGSGKNSRRVLLQMPEERLNWLKRQAERHGFVIVGAYEAAKEEQISGVKSSGKFVLSGIPFEGTLRITDSDAFRRNFANGIGAEKSYGFGLLMIGRV